MWFFKKWVAVLTKPKETFATEKANASIVDGLKHVLIALAIGIPIGWIIAGYLAGSAVGLGLGTSLLGLLIFGGPGILIVPAIIFLMDFILFLIAVVAFWVVAKVLGGQGTFKQQIYILAIIISPILLLSFILYPSSALTFFPVAFLSLGRIFFPAIFSSFGEAVIYRNPLQILTAQPLQTLGLFITLIANYYAFYLVFLANKAIHGLNTLKSAALLSIMAVLFGVSFWAYLSWY